MENLIPRAEQWRATGRVFPCLPVTLQIRLVSRTDADYEGKGKQDMSERINVPFKGGGHFHCQNR